MEFDSRGNLFPYEIVETDISNFEQIFVTDFIESKRRVNLFGRMKSYIEELKQIIDLPFYIWIDGSFVTNRLRPNDIDILVFVESVAINRTEKQLYQLRERFRPEIDSYFIEVLLPTHPNYFLFEMNRTEWLFTFSTSRSFQNKGIIQINF
jgi:predicted nucleotidyltransferase